jgi:hypothetical protein
LARIVDREHAQLPQLLARPQLRPGRRLALGRLFLSWLFGSGFLGWLGRFAPGRLRHRLEAPLPKLEKLLLGGRGALAGRRLEELVLTVIESSGTRNTTRPSIWSSSSSHA